MAGTVTMKDIAEHLGVSIVTVSNALSGKKGVSYALRSQIAAAAQQLGYEYSKTQKSRKQGKKIGILVSERYVDVEMGSSFYWMMYQQIACVASKSDCVTVLKVLDQAAEKKGEVTGLFDETQMDAVIVLGYLKKTYIQKLTRLSTVPVVLMDFWDDDLDCDAILSNNYLGMYRMTRHLLKQGHREIAFLGNIYANSNIMDRYLGYQKALLEWGVEVPQEWLISDRDTETGEMSVVLPENLPTAFACNSDFSAGILIERLEEIGYDVPEDISIVGYDNFLSNSRFADKLTTYDVDIKAMASLCMKTVLKRMEGNTRRTRVQIVNGTMVYRESVKHR